MGEEVNAVFVTVGTTHFDELISATDTKEFAAAVCNAGYKRLIIQAGEGSYIPHRLFPSDSNSCKLRNGIDVEWFSYAPSLDPYFSVSKLVITHAGAGSIFETLKRGIPVVTVPNATLMDNHQTELADRLAADNVLAVATPETLVEIIESLDEKTLKPYHPGRVDDMIHRIDEICGFSKID